MNDSPDDDPTMVVRPTRAPMDLWLSVFGRLDSIDRRLEGIEGRLVDVAGAAGEARGLAHRSPPHASWLTKALEHSAVKALATVALLVSGWLLHHCGLHP